MFALLNRMGNSPRAKLGEKADEQIILPFNRVERRGEGLYYDTAEDTPTPEPFEVVVAIKK